MSAPVAVVCEWFALCTRETTQATQHPILGPVPICARCAERMGIVPELAIVLETEEQGR